MRQKLLYDNFLSRYFYKKQSDYFESLKVIPQNIPEKPFTLLVTSYNNEKWCKKNLNSIFSQNYSNYKVIYVDDASTDRTYEIASTYKNSNFQLIRNVENQGAFKNIYEIVHSLEDDEIVVSVDGDDWLAHDNVLILLNSAYQDDNCQLTYGQYVEYPSYKKGISTPFTDKIWCTSHLRTFYAHLFKGIDKQDLLYKGQFPRTAWDIAMMLPLLKKGSFRFIPNVLYVYNTDNPLNDFRIRTKEQIETEKYFRNKYERTS